MPSPARLPLPPLPEPSTTPPDPDGVAEGRHALLWSLATFAGRIAVVSSFGADSSVLLALVAEIDPSVTVLFLDTYLHLPETLEYRRRLTAFLGLQNVQNVRQTLPVLQKRDPKDLRHAYDPDACCALRKIEPLDRALGPFSAWITGRKRYQAATRAALPVVEQVDGRAKINPLAHWSADLTETEIVRRGLPRHPLVAQGFPSISCAPCTRPVLPGAEPRSGRWTASGKTECGIHRPSTSPSHPSPMADPIFERE